MLGTRYKLERGREPRYAWNKILTRERQRAKLHLEQDTNQRDIPKAESQDMLRRSY